MIRNAVYSDLPYIANVHIECFPYSFSTQMGRKLLIEMYKTYLDRTPQLFLVAEEDNKVVGFVNGYYYSFNNYLSIFIAENRFSFYCTVLMRLITFNIPTWKKLIKHFKSKKNQFTSLDSCPNTLEKTQKGDLLSICVRSQYRGCGIADELINEYEKALLKDEEIKVCTLSVDPLNKRAIAFYLKHGYARYQTSETCDSYYKLIR